MVAEVELSRAGATVCVDNRTPVLLRWPRRPISSKELPLTRHDAERKQKILGCISQAVAERGYPPSVREIADQVGLASTSAVHHHLLALERDGLLERGSHSSRALRLTARGAAELGQAARRPLPI